MLVNKPLHRIAWGSCNNPNKLSAWETLSALRPDRLILLGDNHYADDSKFPENILEAISASPAAIRKEYQKILNDNDWRGLLKVLASNEDGDRGQSSMPHFGVDATFDDHDYGINDGDKTFLYRNESQQLFWDFVGEPTDGTSMRRKQSGVYSSRKVTIPLETKHQHLLANGQITYKVILLDTRSNMDPKSQGSEFGDFLGDEQWEWLESELSDDSVDVFFLGSSIQILPAEKMVEETWGKFPNARERLLRLILKSRAVKKNENDGNDESVDKMGGSLTKRMRMPHVFLLSGDVHSGELLQANCVDGRRLIEVTSSGLTHSFVYSAGAVEVEEPIVTDNVTGEKDGKSMAAVYNEDDDREGGRQRVRKRGFFFSLVHNSYQAVLPHPYRENRAKHYYQGLNYGVIDFDVTPMVGNGGLSVDETISVTIRVFSHKGKEIFSVSQSLSPPASSSSFESNVYIQKSSDESVCQAVGGSISPWRIWIIKFAFACTMILIFVLPILTILVFFCMAVYYITFVAEDRRRERIENNYREAMQRREKND